MDHRAGDWRRRRAAGGGVNFFLVCRALLGAPCGMSSRLAPVVRSVKSRILYFYEYAHSLTKAAAVAVAVACRSVRASTPTRLARVERDAGRASFNEHPRSGRRLLAAPTLWHGASFADAGSRLCFLFTPSYLPSTSIPHQRIYTSMEPLHHRPMQDTETPAPFI